VKQPWQEINRVDQNQTTQRSSIRDDDRHAPSEAKPSERINVAVDLSHRARLEHVRRACQLPSFHQERSSIP